MSCEGQTRSRRPSTCRNDENLEKVRNAISADRRSLMRFLRLLGCLGFHVSEF